MQITAALIDSMDSQHDFRRGISGCVYQGSEVQLAVLNAVWPACVPHGPRGIYSVRYADSRSVVAFIEYRTAGLNQRVKFAIGLLESRIEMGWRIAW